MAYLYETRRDTGGAVPQRGYWELRNDNVKENCKVECIRSHKKRNTLRKSAEHKLLDKKKEVRRGKL